MHSNFERQQTGKEDWRKSIAEARKSRLEAALEEDKVMEQAQVWLGLSCPAVDDV